MVVDRAAWRVGGALGNSARALAGMGLAADLVWDVGDDAMGAWLATELGDVGTPPRVVAAPTSVTVALTHPDGERTFFSHLGHLAVSEPDVLAEAVERGRPGDVVFVGGSFLLPRWQPELASVFARARAVGVTTALDTGWPASGWNADNRGALDDILAHVDLFLPNLEEARGLLNAPDAAPDELVHALDRRTAGRTVLKLGRDGAAWLDHGGVTRHSAPAVDVADTVGAGDTFNAALLAAVRDGRPMRTAVALAVRSASLAVASTPRRYPSWTELEAGTSATA